VSRRTLIRRALVAGGGLSTVIALVTATAAQTSEPRASAALSVAPSFEALPAWAFPVPPSRASAAARGGSRGAGGAVAGRGRAGQDATPRRVPNSTRTYTPAETRDAFNIADWHPDGHPPMPEVVSHGRRPDVRACGFCHLANGFGKPENAPLAGQPAEYILQQMRDFRGGLRLGSEPRIVGPSLMVSIAKAATEEEIRAAAEYFASVPLKPWITVVETDTVPVTRLASVLYVVVDGGGTEPIGRRIVEVPENYAFTELRDGGSGFIAYAPTGSVRRGEALVTTGGGKTIACATCHGADFRGLGPVPSIAGRSPSYMARQLYDFRNGVRRGPSAPLMSAVVERLTDDDIIAILAYLASRAP
jgi:cytochrome c553